MSVDFKIHQNNLSCIKSGLKFSFHENLNEIGLVAFRKSWVYTSTTTIKNRNTQAESFQNQGFEPMFRAQGT